MSYIQIGILNQNKDISWGLRDKGYSVNVNVLHKNCPHFEVDKDKWVMFTSKYISVIEL